MARLVVGAVGAVIGFYLGGPVGALQGFTLAYGLSAGLDPNAKVLGPRLQDLKSPSASYGAPIAYVEGAPRLAGNLIWASSKREVATTTTEGKGGPGVDSTAFTYEMDLLVELAINRCQAIRRIWSNGKLVWSRADDADAETLVASTRTTSWRDLRFYNGGPDQLPDPTYEAAVGVGNAPAYRTRTTVMVEGLNLGGSGQPPVLTFEVLSESSSDYTVNEFASLPFQEPYISDSGPFLAGITAMNPDGFQFLYGDDWDSFAGGHATLKVFDVDQNGEIALSATLEYGAKQGNAMQGTSDVSCMVTYEYDGAFTPSIDYFRVWKADLSHVEFSFDAGTPTVDEWTFAMRGERVAIASITTGGVRLVKVYNASTGVHIVTSSAMVDDMQFCAIGLGVVFALDASGNNVYEIDLVTGLLNQTIPTPYAASQAAIATDEVGNLYLFGSGTIPDPYPVYQWGGAAWTRVVSNQPDLYSSPSTRHAYYASAGILATQRFAAGAPNHEQFYIAVQKVAIVEPTLADVVSRLCLRTGLLTADDIDVTDLSHDVAIADGLVRALAVSQVSTTRATLQILMGAYLFECVEADTLRFVRRGGASVATIPFDDMGASDDGNAEPLPLKRVNDIEAAARVSVKYANTLNDFQDGLESADRLVTESTAEQVIELPLGFEPLEAKKLADANTLDLAVTLIQIGPIALPRKYAHLEPTDVVTLTAQDGSTFRARIVKGTIGGGLYTFDLTLDDATVINSAAATDDDYVSSTLLRLLSDTDLEMLDIPILRDADDALGPYAAVSAGPKWSGAQLDKSVDDVSFSKIGTFTSKTAIGATTTVLGDFTPGTFDEINSVTVDVGDSTLASYTKDAVLAGTAAGYLVGDEILFACNAALQSPGVYKLSSLLRAQRGTESFTSTHEAGERVVLLQPSGAGLRKVSDELAELNATRYYRATTIGASTADAEVDMFVDTGVAKKPFAPVDLHINKDSGFLIEWNRRSRLSSVLFGLTQPPLGELTEAYDIELRNASDILMDAATVTEPSYSATTLLPVGTSASYFWGLKVIGSDLVAMGFDRFTSSKPNYSLVVLDAGGAVTETTPVLGQRAIQWANDGTALYALTETYSPDLSTAISTQVQKFTIGTLSSVDATNTASSFGDYQGLAFDGTDVWISESGANLVRRLNKSTLVSIATYAVTGGPSTLFYRAGKLWICCGLTDELVCFDTTSHTEDFRVAVAGGLFDVYVNADVAVTAGYGTVNTLDAGTGTLIASYSGLFFNSAEPQRTLVEFDGSIVVGVQTPLFSVGGGAQAVLVLIDATTGLETRVIPMLGDIQLFFLSGTDGTDLYISSRLVLEIATRRYQLAPADLAGYTFTVWQLSATVGRGYPAILEL